MNSNVYKAALGFAIVIVGIEFQHILNKQLWYRLCVGFSTRDTCI